ncbi:hypothetical protein F2Q68_00029289 [Brassica cretica]|uniref:Uncharacterized protein n=1 Tax=Brassica cretica TaxID=69181 RepID=A0A8S9GBL9_BRACR|nr:hypothetical protein F2Q68_00029289 [Brassica cretica]
MCSLNHGCALLALGRKQEAVLVLEQGYNTALLQTADVKQLLELHELLNVAKREIDVTVNHHAAETTRQETPVSPLGSYTAFGTSDNKVSTSMAVFESGACSSANTHESSMEFGEHSKTNKESGGSTELLYLVRRGCLVETKRTGQIFLPFSLSVCTLIVKHSGPEWGKFTDSSPFRQAIQSNPAAGEAWKWRGQARAALGEFAEAVEALTRALELEPKSPDILHERGISILDLRTSLLPCIKALECIDQVLQVDNRVWKAYHFRGFVFHGLGEHRTLLSVGVSLKAITRKGLTPLPYAAQGSQLDLVKYLVKKGANVRATTKAVSQVRNSLGLGTREAEAITVDVTSKAYRKRLAIHEVFSSQSSDNNLLFFRNLQAEASTMCSDGEPSDDNVAALLRKATHGLRLSRETAMSIASKATSKGAQEDDCLESLRKTRPDKELAEKMGKPGQTEITLKNDLADPRCGITKAEKR